MNKDGGNEYDHIEHWLIAPRPTVLVIVLLYVAGKIVRSNLSPLTEKTMNWLNDLLDWFRRKGITKGTLLWFFTKYIFSKLLMVPYLSQKQRKSIVTTGDPIRFGTIYLSLEQISKNQIPGSLAECGVYKGRLSKFLLENLPHRRLYLFDTFQGFDSRDSTSVTDNRFKNTSEEAVLNYIGETKNVVIRKGYFPETTIGMEKERFAFVMIDFDKYDPTYAALEFFYPRMNKDGFIFVHDYSSSESDWTCSRALNTFLADKPEKPILLPDAWGTALFRKG